MPLGFICSFSPSVEFFFSSDLTGWNLNSRVSATGEEFSLADWKAWAPSGVAWISFCERGGVFVSYVCKDASSMAWRCRRPIRRTPKLRGRSAAKAYTASSERLTRYLTEHLQTRNDIVLARVVFGPGESFYAWSPKGGAIWAGIPRPLETKLDLKRKEKDELRKYAVVLGYKKSWMMVHEDGHFERDLCGFYPELETALQEHGTDGITFVSLDPWNAAHFYVVFKNNIVLRRLSKKAMGITEDGTLKFARKHASESSKAVRVWSSTGQETSTLETPPATSEALEKIETDLKKNAEVKAAEEKKEEKSNELKEVKEATLQSIKASKKSLIASELAIIAAIASCTIM